MIVLDTSAAVELALNLPLGVQVQQRIADPEVSLHAPELLIIETLQVLRRRVAAGITTQAEATDALALLDDLDLSYHGHQPISQRIWALRDNLTAYDATYIALAEALDATVLTSDARLARSPGHQATVELLA